MNSFSFSALHMSPLVSILFITITLTTASLLGEKEQPLKKLVIPDETDRESLSSSPETIPENNTTSPKLRLRNRRVSFASLVVNATTSPDVLETVPEGDDRSESSVSGEFVDEETVRHRIQKRVPPSQQFFGDEDYIPYFDDNGETGRDLFDSELPIAGDATLMWEVEGKNVIMTRYDAAQLCLVTLGSFIALYGWTLFSIWLYKYYTS